jgi:catechol 2,3-dioxygenase-like lactoylglutathione lyase family enzyme
VPGGSGIDRGDRVSDRITANLPSRDFDSTITFYEALGFTVGFRDAGWMIISRGPLEIEFFPLDHEPRESCFSACIRVDDLDALYAQWSMVGLPSDCRSIPRITPPADEHGLRIFALVDPDGSLFRCIGNRSTTG